MNYNLNQKQKAWVSLAGIATIFALCLFILCTEGRVITKVVIAIGGLCLCWPLAKTVCNYVLSIASQPIRILRRNLPKCGFIIEETKWNEDKTILRFVGKFRDDNFLIDVLTQSFYVFFYDLPWASIESSYPEVGRLMEAINDTNANASNMSVIMCDPDENGIRNIYTRAKTILPIYDARDYIGSLMTEMLNCQFYLRENLQKERPWMNASKRGPIGFNVASTHSDETVAPAAKDNTSIN